MDLTIAKKFMDDLLVSLYKKGGSDLFLIAGAAPAMRIHGKITPIMEKKLNQQGVQFRNCHARYFTISCQRTRTAWKCRIGYSCHSK